MSFSTDKRKCKVLTIITSVVLALAIITGALAAYVNDYYRADQKAIEAFAPMHKVTIATLENGAMVFRPENATQGFIFYPGGKVAYTAYQPLMAACAEQGILCVLVEMPFNLAVLDINAADGIQAQFPEIEDWYIGGHSLGGSMAAAYLAEHIDDYRGLILLGSYSTADLSHEDIKVLSVYGSEDKVMNREKYLENKDNLPDGFSEIVIDGGCHAYFGMYGEQDGDGTPTISNEKQIMLTAEIVVNMMK